MYQRESRLAFNNAYDNLLVVLADDGVSLPVANPTAGLNDSWTILNGEAVRNRASPVDLAVTLLTWLVPRLGISGIVLLGESAVRGAACV